jgi:hypothetical protein
LKKSIVFLILLFISGCSGYNDLSEVNIKNKISLKNIKSWNVVYDSTSGYNKPEGTMVDNELAFTPYQDVNGVLDRPSPEYIFSDLRGKKLSTGISKLLGEDGVKLANNADGVIHISRPTFLDEGRYILRTYVDFYGKDDKKVASIVVFNNLRKETTSKGIRYVEMGGLMDDGKFAELCAKKISGVLNETN